MIKCKCKSIKKNFACNKIKTDSSIIVTEKGFVLRCGDKCKSKIAQKTESNDTQKVEQKKPDCQFNYLKCLIPFLILSIAIILGYFLVIKI